MVVVAPPPTPNGDLHVGHLAGPYLAADAFARFERLRGRRVVTALSADENQSYVVTTAERLGVAPRDLARDSHADLQRTLEQADMSFDIVGRPDATYDSFVRGWLNELVEAGAFVEKEVDAIIDPRTGRQLVESYVGGRCPVCFLDTRGNVCETCGHPSDPTRLIRPTVVGAGGAAIEPKRITAMVLPLERYRARLERHYAAQRTRPELRVLLDTLLERPLPDFPITYRSDWGLPVDRPGWESSVYNVWAEMYPGHLHWTQMGHASAQPDAAGTALWESADGVRYVQFIGFDNSWFYAVAHVAIALAAHDASVPVAPLPQIVTNQFYLLENFKFSTSLGHVIWGRDLLAAWEPDPVRLYLCLSNPETQESNFTVSDMEHMLDERLVRPFERAAAAWNRLLSTDRVDTALNGTWEAWQRDFRRRFELSYEADTFSLRRAAATLMTYLDFVASELELADREYGTCPAAAIGYLALYAAPLMPGFAERLAVCAGVAAAPAWDSPPVQRADELGQIPSDLLALRRSRDRTRDREARHVH